MEAADQYLHRAIDQSPDHSRAWINLGVVLAHQGHYDQSFDAFARIVGPAAAHSNIGAIMARQGRRLEAQQAFQRSLELDRTLEQPQAFLAYFAKSDGALTAEVQPAQYSQTR